MAEAAGLAVGGIALVSLFSTAIECLDYITLAKHHGPDFEIALVKFELLTCRLGAWGQSLSLASPGRESQLLRDSWDRVGQAVGGSLVGIRKCFDEQDNLKHRYGLEPVQAHTAALASDGVSRSNLDEIESGFGITSRRRQRDTTLSKKVWWAIHDKKKFDALIADVAFFVDNLERLGDKLNSASTQERLLREAISEVRTRDTVRLLESAEQSLSGITTTPSGFQIGDSPGHTYVHNIIKGRFLMGDVGSSSERRNHYEGNTIEESGSAIGGNASVDAMEKFFKT